jgi:hypothetical protein
VLVGVELGIGVGVMLGCGVAVIVEVALGEAVPVTVEVELALADGDAVDVVVVVVVAEGVLAWSNAGLAIAAPAGRANAPRMIAPMMADRPNRACMEPPSVVRLHRTYARE